MGVTNISVKGQNLRFERGTVTYRDPSQAFVTNLSCGLSNQNDVGDALRRSLEGDPNWLALVEKGQSASHHYSKIEVTYRPRRTNVYTVEKYPGNASRVSDFSGSFIYDPWLFANRSDDSALADLALKRLKSRIAEYEQSYQAFAPAAELRELRGLVVSAAFSATDLVYALLKIKKTKGKSAAQFASHTWLNWSFAISPTLSDIKNLASVIQQELNDPGGRKFTVRGSAKKDWVTSTTLNNSSSFGGNSKIKARCEHNLSYRYVAGLKSAVRSANNYSTLSQFGIGVPQLVPALWELTAFSWLFDYFSTVGDYLEDTFTVDQNQSIYCVRTKKYICDVVFNVGPSEGYYVTGSTVSGTPSSGSFFETIRLPSSSIPSRQLRFKTVDEIGKGAISKLLNLGSILVGGKALSGRY